MDKNTQEKQSRTRERVGGVMLLIFSALAVLIATTPGSVTVYHPGATASETYSFFQQIPEAGSGICLLFAAVGSCLCLMLAVADLVLHKEGIRTGLMVTALASMTLAVMPLLAEKSVFVLPNMLQPLLMGAVCVCTYMVRKLRK